MNPKVLIERAPFGLWPALRNGLLGAVAALLLTSFIPNEYRSEAKLLPTPGQNQGNVQVVAAALGLGLSNLSQDPTANYEDILNSRWVGEQLLQGSYEFHQARWRFGGLESRHQRLMDYLGVKSLDQGMRALHRVMGVKRDIKSGVIIVSAQTQSADLSQALVHRSVELLGQFLAEKTQTSGTARAKYSDSRLAEVQDEYGQAESALKEFLLANRNYSVSADPEVRLKGGRLEMNLGIKKQVLTTLALNHEQALLDAKNDIPVLNVLDDANLPQEKASPARSLLALAAFVLVGMATLIRFHWAWIRSRLFPPEGGPA